MHYIKSDEGAKKRDAECLIFCSRTSLRAFCTRSTTVCVFEASLHVHAVGLAASCLSPAVVALTGVCSAHARLSSRVTLFRFSSCNGPRCLMSDFPCCEDIELNELTEWTAFSCSIISDMAHQLQLTQLRRFGDALWPVRVGVALDFQRLPSRLPAPPGALCWQHRQRARRHAHHTPQQRPKAGTGSASAGRPPQRLFVRHHPWCLLGACIR